MKSDKSEKQRVQAAFQAPEPQRLKPEPGGMDKIWNASLAESLTYALPAVVIGWAADQSGVITALVSFQLFAVLSLAIYLNLFKAEQVKEEQEVPQH